MKIVVLDGYTLNPGDLSWEGISHQGEFTVYERTPAQEIVPRIGDAEIIFVNKTPITAETLGQCPALRFIGVLATGYNVVDTAAAKARGIPVCNIPTYGTTAVAQYVMALLLELCHHVGAHSDDVHRGGWGAQPDFCYWKYPLVELSGKTFGVVGFGRIGRATAKLAAAFGMKVLAYDATPPAQAEEGVELCASLQALYARADVISLHCPLLPQTQGMIDKEAIGKMKDGVLLLNTSRGPLICERDLAQALGSGKVGGAALDVVSSEPIGADNPLLQAKNCIITPHIAWAPKESRQRLMDIAADNLRAFLAGKPVNVVNM